MGEGFDFATILIEPNTLCREGLASILSMTRFRPLKRLSTVEQIDEIGLPADAAIFFLADLGSKPDLAAEGVRKLKSRFPACRLLVLSEHNDLAHMVTVLRAGAEGYLIKSMSSDALVKSLDLLAMGEPVIPAGILDMISRDGIGYPATERVQVSRPLSGRETGILCHLARGESNKVIARQLDITEATVKVHIKAILRKIQVRNRTQAAVWALDQGLTADLSGQLALAATRAGPSGLPSRAP